MCFARSRDQYLSAYGDWCWHSGRVSDAHLQGSVLEPLLHIAGSNILIEDCHVHQCADDFICTATSTSLLTISPLFPALCRPTRVICASECPCRSDADRR